MTDLRNREQAILGNVRRDRSSMKRKQMTIAIKGGYGYGNFGDDALMLAAHETVKRVFVSESIVFCCKDADYIQKILPDALVVPEANADGKDVDLVVYGGGTQFYSFPLTTQQGVRSFLKRVSRNAKHPFLLGKKIMNKTLKASFSTNYPSMVAIGIGLGPFVENCPYVRRVRELFMRMKYVAVRDIHSYELCREWGCRNVFLRSDLCYLPGLWNEQALHSRNSSPPTKIKRIGVITRDWPHTHEGDSYAAALFQVVDELRANGKHMEFISFQAGYDHMWAKRLAERNQQNHVWNPQKQTIQDFLKLLSGYDAFITARYHGAIFASILRKPVVCIEVEQKLRLVSDLFGGGARLWTYPFSSSECLRHICDLEDSYSRSVECLACVVERQGVLTEKIVDELRLAIGRDS